MAKKKAAYEITAEDKTRAGIESAKRGLQDLSNSALNLKGALAGALSVISVGALGAAFKGVVDKADELSKLSQKVGVAVESLSALNYAAGLADVSLDQLGNGLKRLAANAADTAGGVGEAKDAFRALDIDVRNAGGGIKSTDQLLAEIADRFAGAEDGVNKTAIAMKIFGKAGADLIPLLNGGADGLELARIEAERLGVVLSKETGKAAEEFNDNLTRLGSAATGLKMAIAEDMLPGLTSITTAMAEAAKEAGLLGAAWVGLGGLGAALFTDEFASDAKKLKNLRQELSDLQRQLRNKEGQGLLHDWVFGDELDIQGEIDRVVSEMDALQKKMAGTVDGTGDLGKAADTTKNKLADLTKETKGLSAAQKAAQKEQDAYAARLTSLIDTLDPTAKATADYLQAVADLDRAWVEGLLSGDEYDRLLLALATDTKAIAKEQEDAVKAQEEAAKKRTDLARKEAEAMQRPFDEAAEGIQNSFTDAFAEIYNGNVRSFGDMARQIKGVFVRLAAEITTLMVFNPKASIGGLLASVGLGGSGAAMAGTTAGGGGGFSLGGLSSFLGPTGSLLGIGALGGGALASLTGGSAVGGSLGGAAGAYGGMLLGSGSLGGITGSLVGALGAAGNFVIPGLGMLAGGLLGSLFGKKKPSNKSAWGAIDLSSGQTSSFGNMTGSKFSQESVDARDAFFQSVGGFSSVLQQTTGGQLAGTVSADIGHRDGTQVSGLGAGRYETPEAALQGIFRAMMNDIQGVGAEWDAVFARLDLGDLEQAVADLQTAGYIINRDYVQAEPLSEAAAAIKQITDAFDPLIDSANRLGLATAGLYDEQNRLINQLRTDYNDAIDQAILSITDPMAAALADFDKVAEDRLRNARDLGADLVDVERLNALERAKIVEQYNAQANQALLSANQSIEQYLSGLRAGSGSYLSPNARLSNAETEFQSLLAAAQGGDVNARAGLTGSASNLIDASRDVFGSSEMFFQRLDFIDKSLGNLVGETNSTATFDNIGMTIAQGNATNEYWQKAIVDRLDSLVQVVANQQSALDRMNAK